MKYLVVLYLGVMMFVCIVGCYYFSYEENTLDTKSPSKRSAIDTPLRHVCIKLIRDFDVPINDEFFYCRYGSGNIKYSIQQGERLQSVLDKILESIGNIAEYEIIHGQLCIFPTKQNNDDVASPLDLLVTVELGTISTWDAIKKVVIALNQQMDLLDKPVFADPEEVEWTKVVTPLFLQPLKITTCLNNVTAREALCFIFSQSELDIDYRYDNDPKYHILRITSHLDRFNASLSFRPERVEMEEACWWWREVDEQLASWDVVPKYQDEREKWCGDKVSKPVQPEGESSLE